MRIAKFRQLVDALDWSTGDLYGNTLVEFKRCDVPSRLNERIRDIQEAILFVSPRFDKDHKDATQAIASANKMINRWLATQFGDSALLGRNELKDVFEAKFLVLMSKEVFH